MHSNRACIAVLGLLPLVACMAPQRVRPAAAKAKAQTAPLAQTQPRSTESRSDRLDPLDLHAEQHRAAATALGAFEDPQCNGVPASEREACPFVGGQVIRVENVPNGVRLVMANGVSPQPLLKVIGC